MLNKNSGNRSFMTRAYPAVPDLHKFILPNHSEYLFESNSLFTYKLDSPDMEDRLNKSLIEVNKPQFSYSCPDSAKSICLNITHRCCFSCTYCLSGDTKISLLNGKEEKIEDLAKSGELFWVYSLNKSNNVVPGLATAFPTRAVNEVCVVTLDNGEKVRCTLDHKFMLRDGTYREAKYLKQNDSLMPLYKRVCETNPRFNGKYLEFYNPGTNNWSLVHSMVAWSVLGGYNGKTRQVCHHKNVRDPENRSNNDPENLEMMTELSHIRLHHSFGSAFKGVPQSIEHKERISESQRVLWSRESHKNRMRESFRKSKLGLKKLWSTKEYREFILRSRRIAKQQKEINKFPDTCSKTLSFLQDCEQYLLWNKYIRPLNKLRRILAGTAHRPNLTEKKREQKLKDLKELDSKIKSNLELVNHKVSNVEIVQLDEPEMMFDLYVDEHHNFALSSGVFSSNCFVKNFYDGGLSGTMSFETAKQFIDNYVKGDTISIGFFGGEPLMNMEVITKVVDYCKGKFKSSSFHVTTNSVLLPNTSPFIKQGQRIGEYLDENNFSSIVSIDGPESVHNKYRVYPNGSGTFKDVIHALEFMRGSNFLKRTTLRGTFTSEITSSSCSLKDRISFMNSLVYNGLGSYVSLEPVMLTENSCIDAGEDMAIMEKPDFMEALQSQYYEAAEWFIKEYQTGRKPSWHQIMMWVKRLYWRVHSCTECFTGDTKVSLLDGTERRMDELVGKGDFDFYSYDPTLEIVVPTKGDVIKTGEGKRIVQVVLDSGDPIKCTPEHQFLLRDGTYKEAQYLKPGDSLMPLYRTKDSDGYEMLQDPGKDWVPTHVRVCKHSVIKKLKYDRKTKTLSEDSSLKYHVRHHLNYNKIDNRPDNLCGMLWGDHYLLHSDHMKGRASGIMISQYKNPDSLMNKYIGSEKHVLHNQEISRLQREDPNSKLNKWVKSQECNNMRRHNAIKAANTKSEKRTKALSVNMIKRNMTKEARAKSSWHMTANHAWHRYLKSNNLQESDLSLEYFKNNIFEQVKPFNHKVTGVVFLDEVQDVYCVRVNHPSHNFALSSGVFVHNCGAGVGYLSCNPEGNISACHRESETFIGNLKNGIDEEKRSIWVDNRLYKRDKCPTCKFRYVCGGGCREASLLWYKDIKKPVEADCQLKEIWMKCALWFIDVIGDDCAKLIENPRDRVNRNKKPINSQESHNAQSKIDSFISFIKKGDFVLNFSKKPLYPEFIDDCKEKNPNVKIIDIDPEFNPKHMELFNCGENSVVFIRDGVMINKILQRFGKDSQ